MRANSTKLTGIPPSTATAWAGRVSVVPALAVLALGALVQGLTYLNHDVAWVLDSSVRLLRGGTFGEDVVAANPPLIWWLSAAVAGVADFLGTDAIATFRGTVLLLAAVALVAVDRGLSGHFERPARSALLVLLALLLTILVHRDFGQREHLAIMLCLPWLTLATARAEGGTWRPRHAALAGVAAGIGIAFKPHFLAVPALIWTYLALRRGGFLQWKRPRSSPPALSIC